jgi:UDP-glucuronate 4-epimerase
VRALVTGSAGFIGFHVARRLLADGWEVMGFDAFTPYYDPALKEARNAILAREPGFRLVRAILEDKAALDAAWDGFAPDLVIHLAAQAGVRYSIDHPETYLNANLAGTFNVLEAARRTPPKHLMIASTSSAYGANAAMPWRETDRSAHPMTFYAATKAATELMGHSYAHLFGTPMTFFRFFTVYGPWSRPDMAPIKFARAIFAGEPIDLYNAGDMVRDFTFIDDLVEAVVRLAARPPVAGAPAGPDDSLSPVAPHRVVNIGAGSPQTVLEFVDALERAIGRPAQRRCLPIQPGDPQRTEAATDLLFALTGFRPMTAIADGVPAFVAWYRDHYGV